MQPPKIAFEGFTPKGLAVKLRYPVPDDVNALWEYINQLSTEQTFILFQGEEIAIDDETAWLNDKLQSIAHKQSVMVLALYGLELIGVAEIDKLDHVNRHIGSLGISVAYNYRGRGVGELLMKIVIAEALLELAGLKIITLEVFGNNSVAQNLYGKLGFTEYGRIPGGIIHRDTPVDDVYMFRRCND